MFGSTSSKFLILWKIIQILSIEIYQKLTQMSNFNEPIQKTTDWLCGQDFLLANEGNDGSVRFFYSVLISLFCKCCPH